MKVNKPNSGFFLILSSSFTILCGYRIVTDIANRENPFLGYTFNIVLGYTMIIICSVGILAWIKNNYFQNNPKPESKI